MTLGLFFQFYDVSQEYFIAQCLHSFGNGQERHDKVEEQYNTIEVDDATENSIVIDPALTTPNNVQTPEYAFESPEYTGESPEYTVETPSTSTPDDQVLDVLAATRTIADKLVSGGSIVDPHTDERLASEAALPRATKIETPAVKVKSTFHSAAAAMPAGAVQKVILGNDPGFENVEHAMATVHTLLSAAENAADIASLHGIKH